MEFVEVNPRRKPPSPRRLYRVALVRVNDDTGTSEILGIHCQDPYDPESPTPRLWPDEHNVCDLYAPKKQEKNQ